MKNRIWFPKIKIYDFFKHPDLNESKLVVPLNSWLKSDKVENCL